MTPDQLEQIQKTLTETIKIVVNGKIDRMNVKLDTYIKEDNEYKTRFKEDTDVWRKGADEKLELVSNIRGFGKVFMYIVGIIVAVGTVYKIFK